MKIKILALVLAAVTLLGCLVSCATPDSETDETTPAPADTTPGDTSEVTTVPAVTEPTFEDKNFEKADFVVFNRTSTASSYPGEYIYCEAMNGSVVDDAVFKRNSQVEQDYNIVISTIEDDKPHSTVETLVKNNEVNFDVIHDERSEMASLATKGILYDFNELPGVNYDRNYWDANAKEGYEVADKLFFMVNDVSVANLSRVRFLYFNTGIVEQYELTSPYEYVDNNEWTIENFLALVSAVSAADDTADSIRGLAAETGGGNGVVIHQLVGCGINFVARDKDGVLVNGLTNDNEKIIDILGKMYTVYSDENVVWSYDKIGKGAIGDKYINSRSEFAAGKFLFIESNMACAAEFADMPNYGVAPNPKFNAKQEKYYHKCDKYALIWAIPNVEALDFEKIGYVMEYWAYQSSKTVMPAYYEITVKSKRVRDEKSVEVIDLIKNSIRYDLADIYTGSPATACWNAYEAATSRGSALKGQDRAIKAKLDEVYKAISGE